MFPLAAGCRRLAVGRRAPTAKGQPLLRLLVRLFAEYDHARHSRRRPCAFEQLLVEPDVRGTAREIDVVLDENRAKEPGVTFGSPLTLDIEDALQNDVQRDNRSVHVISVR